MNSEGNHGEDVKKYYFYPNSTHPLVLAQRSLRMGSLPFHNARAKQSR